MDLLTRCCFAFCLIGFAVGGLADPKPETAPLSVKWIHGFADPDPAIQAYQLDPDTFILRENISLNYQAPFLYLIFGKGRVALLDTGAENTNIARKFPLRSTVDHLIEQWSSSNHRPPPPLVVLHTGNDADHRAGDEQFEDRANTEISDSRPRKIEPIDLGERILLAIPTPGHDAGGIAYYDPQSELLFTGDLIYPGRLTVQDWSAYRSSVARLAKFADSHRLQRLLGSHIELTSKGKEYPETSSYHPDEHVLELEPAELHNLQEALKTLRKPPKEPVVLDSFHVMRIKR